eukprot:TRINITY_DN2581_c0_g1_i1.p1 TRINITY_DN2581_c0_g1~~TRINITY_DN2581_c0_g1_i1.p1  ORF type:complete len:524 (-),score=114.43 TRINITY_DN2581_c0_g1_i1:11-1582(-)
MAATPTPVLTQQEVDMLFSNLEIILNLNMELLKEIKLRMAVWTNSQKIGDVFLKMASFFKMYSVYCHDYEKSVVLIKQKTKENPQFVQFLETTSSVLDDHMTMTKDRADFSLSSFLIMPIQRVPRYILLLRELLKYTWPTHPDYNNIKQALDQLQEVANHVNDSIKQATRMDQLLRIEQAFGWQLSLMDPARKFVREGRLMKVTSRFVVETYYFLFNDMLIYAYKKNIGANFTLKGKVPMGTTWIRDLPDSDDLQNAWQIVGVKKTYTVFASSPKEKQEWMKDMNLVIEQLVALDPNLVNKRSTQIQTTKRITSFFWKMFTVAPEKLQAEPNQVESEERLTRDRPVSRIDKQHLKSVRSFDDDSISASESAVGKTVCPRSSLQPGSTLSPTTSPIGSVVPDPLSTNSALDTSTPAENKQIDQSAALNNNTNTDSFKVVTAYNAPFSYTPNTGSSSTPAQPTQTTQPSRPVSTRVAPQDSLRAPLLGDTEDVRYNAMERGQGWNNVGLQHKPLEPGCCASCNIM